MASIWCHTKSWKITTSYFNNSNYRNWPPADLITQEAFCGYLHRSKCCNSCFGLSMEFACSHGASVGLFWFLWNPERRVVLTVHEYKRAKVAVLTQEGKSRWNSVHLLQTVPSSTPRSMSPLPLFSVLLSRELLKLRPVLAFGKWKVGSPRKGWQMWEKITGLNGIVGEHVWSWRLTDGGWDTRRSCSFNDFRGNTRNREILWCRGSAHALYAPFGSRRRLVFVQLTFRDHGHQLRAWWKPSGWAESRAWEDDVSVSCWLCSDVWNLDRNSRADLLSKKKKNSLIENFYHTSFN